ncbi:hypothetical protein MHYP_G00124750 [Metynnis hypsauchen]
MLAKVLLGNGSPAGDCSSRRVVLFSMDFDTSKLSSGQEYLVFLKAVAMEVIGTPEFNDLDGLRFSVTVMMRITSHLWLGGGGRLSHGRSDPAYLHLSGNRR